MQPLHTKETKEDLLLLWRALTAPREPLNAWSHLAGALLTILATPFLLLLAPPSLLPGLLIYLLAMVGLFTASALTHSLHDPSAEERLERWDRAFIYLLIAGTYTPLVQTLLPVHWGFWMLVAIWGQALLGLLLLLLPFQLPRLLSTGLYLLMGWTIVFCLGQIWPALSLWQSIFLLSGAAFYSCGALIYAFRWPDPCPATFGFHGIWHLLVVAGAAAFFCLLLSITQTGLPAPL